MNIKKYFLAILFFTISFYCFSNNPLNNFIISSKDKVVDILVDQNENTTVLKSVDLLVNDITMVTGIQPRVIHSVEESIQNLIIVGTIKSDVILNLNKSGTINSNNLKGKWECFSRELVNSPYSTVNKALVICGSDKRGTAYGVLSISEKIGVSPWYWWADIKPNKNRDLSIHIEKYLSATPSVKYRGIFLNDEDWGLQPWAANTFEPETGDIGPKTYAKIFELLLRLKANTIWPAMHNCTKAFYSYPDNPKVADTFGILVGSSHAEPMLRNNVDEWDKKTMGSFNYKTNKTEVDKYWRTRAVQSKNYENIYTLGMRGIHDSGMEGMANMSEKVEAVSNIINSQRKIISEEINASVDEVPQVFVPYKEVLDIYDNGLEVPEDVTIMWTDDNYGYIKRLAGEKEMNRKGGCGVYYHASYWGRPHDYLWLSSTHPSLIREEMIKAYQHNAKQMWILNVGDIKPLEYNIQLFMDMAWDAESFVESGNELIHMKNWYASIFGEEYKEQLDEIMTTYNNLNFQRRPEFMGWSQTEPTRDVNPTEFNHFYFGDQAAERLNLFAGISSATSKIYNQIDADKKDAFYHLVYYPVKCASHMNRKILYLEKSYLYGKQGRASANDYAQKAKLAYDSILIETNYFNKKLAGGKWDGMMSMKPRNLPVFHDFMTPQWEVPEISLLGISIEGDQQIRPGESVYGNHRLLPFKSNIEKSYFIDLYQKGKEDVKWEIETSHNWITVSENKGVLSGETNDKETRIYIGFDKGKLPGNDRNYGAVSILSNGKKQKINIRLDNVEKINNVYCEDERIISIYAENAHRQINHSKTIYWKKIKGLGYSGNSMQFFDENDMKAKTVDADVVNKPVLEYDFINLSSTKAIVKIYCIPVHPINKSYSLRLGVKIDDGEMKIEDHKTYGRSDKWKQNVLENNALIEIEIPELEKGKHTLQIMGIDPGVIIDRIVIDFNSGKEYYGNLKETVN